MDGVSSSMVEQYPFKVLVASSSLAWPIFKPVIFDGFFYFSMITKNISGSSSFRKHHESLCFLKDWQGQKPIDIPWTFWNTETLMKLLLQIIAESFQGKIEKILNRKKVPSFLSLSVVQFTNESWVNGIIRQGKLEDYIVHYGVDNTQRAWYSLLITWWSCKK